MISFHVLGSGSAVPSPDHGQPAYWVVVDGHSLLLDPGPGALVRLVNSPHCPDSLDGIETVLLTHFHLDHCADLAPLLFALRSPLLEATRPLHLVGPPGLTRYLDGLRQLYGRWMTPLRRRLELTEIEPGQTLLAADAPVAGWRAETSGHRHSATGPSLLAFAAAHGDPAAGEVSLGYRFVDETGRSVVFSGDSGPCPDLRRMARETDLLVVECAGGCEQAVVGHLTAEDVGALGAETKPGKLVLTHLQPTPGAAASPEHEQRLFTRVGRTFTGPLQVAHDGDLYEVSQPDPDSEEQP
ncbi:MAG: MBL fold metallo-hydrolase [bacterium]